MVNLTLKLIVLAALLAAIAAVGAGWKWHAPVHVTSPAAASLPEPDGWTWD